MKYYYDFHIHSALSPCSDDDMTPCNIVNMAKIKGLDAIAVTDHNTIGNVRSAMLAGEKAGVLVIPGMEIETSEEVHLLTLFPSLEAAADAEKIIKNSLPGIKNNEKIFGNQLLFDENDNIIGSESQMLITATRLGIYEACRLVKEYGGAVIPAHVDRHSYSVITNLGFLPEDLPVSTVEISSSMTEIDEFIRNKKLEKYNVIRNSDAHNLWSISERINFIEVFNNSALNLLQNFI